MVIFQTCILRKHYFWKVFYCTKIWFKIFFLFIKINFSSGFHHPQHVYSLRERVSTWVRNKMAEKTSHSSHDVSSVHFFQHLLLHQWFILHFVTKICCQWTKLVLFFLIAQIILENLVVVLVTVNHVFLVFFWSYLLIDACIHILGCNSSRLKTSVWWPVLHHFWFRILYLPTWVNTICWQNKVVSCHQVIFKCKRRLGHASWINWDLEVIAAYIGTQPVCFEANFWAGFCIYDTDIVTLVTNLPAYLTSNRKFI